MLWRQRKNFSYKLVTCRDNTMKRRREEGGRRRGEWDRTTGESGGGRGGDRPDS